METGAAAAATTRPITIVVADDSASLRSLVRITFASQGWQIVEADTPARALETVRTLHPDVALLDITFGDTGPDGLAVCAELKADPATAGIPIVILTGHDDPAERRRADATGANAFIAKPFGPIDLMRVVRDLLPEQEQVPAIGVYLLDAGAVHPKQLQDALDEQRALDEHGTPKRLGDVLVERGAASPVDIERALLRQMHERVRDAAHPARVLVVDDHPAVREGLRQLLASDPELMVAGEAANAEEALALARTIAPDVILLDNEMPGRHGIEVLPELKAVAPAARVVMFSLEHGVRDHAIRGGAAAFVPKDAPPSDVLRALRVAPRTGNVEPLGTNAFTPTLPRISRLRRNAVMASAILLAYVVLFLLVLEPIFGASAGAFSVAPVAIAGALLGPEVGLVTGFVTAGLTLILWSVTGHAIGEPVLEIGGSAIGFVLLLLVGVGTGATRYIGARFDPRRRRIEALAEVTQALAGLSRTELIDAFLEAMRRVLPAHAILLYANVAGDASFLGATGGAATLRPERITALVTSAMHTGIARPLDVAEGDRPTAGMASALIVPVVVSGEEVRGAIVLLHRDAKRYRVEDAQLVRPFAQYLWIVLRSAPSDRLGTASAHVRQTS